MYDFAGKVQRQSSRCTLTFLARISLGKVWHKSSILEPVTDNPLWTISDARMDDGNPCCRHTMNLPGRLIAWSQTTGHTKGQRVEARAHAPFRWPAVRALRMRGKSLQSTTGNRLVTEPWRARHVPCGRAKREREPRLLSLSWKVLRFVLEARLRVELGLLLISWDASPPSDPASDQKITG